MPTPSSRKRARSPIAPLAFGADTGRRMAPTDAVEPLADTPERPSIDLRATLGRGDGFARVLERAGVGAAEADAGRDAGRRRACRSTTSGPARASTSTLGRRAEPDGRAPARQARLPRPLRPASSRSSRVDGALQLDRDPDRGRRHAAAHPGPGRPQPLPLGARRRRARRGRSKPISARSPPRSRCPPGSAPTTASTSSSSIAAPRPARPRPASCSMPGSTASSGRDLQLMHWSSDGRSQWFEASGVGAPERRHASSRCPAGSPRASACACIRSSAIRGCTSGIDFGAAYGTPILAATDGTRRAAPAGHGGYGNQVRLNHAGGLGTGYSHMSRIAVAPGAARPPGPGDRLCRLDRPLDRPASPLRALPQRRAINPRSVRFASRAQLVGRRARRVPRPAASLLGTPVGAARTEQAQRRPATPRTRALAAADRHPDESSDRDRLGKPTVSPGFRRDDA